MKILILSYSLAAGGAERFAIELANALSERNEVSLLVTDTESKGANAHYKQEILPGVNYINLGKKSGHSPSALFDIFKVIKRLKPDVVHSNTDLFHLILPSLFITKSRYYHTIHSLASYYLPSRILLPLFRPFYRRRVKAITISNVCSDSFRQLYKLSNDAVIYNGRSKMTVSQDFEDVRERITRFKKNDRLFIHVGRYSREKNQDVLINAFRELEGVKLVIIGRDYPKSIITGCDPEKYLFVGECNNVADYLACSEFFILSSTFEGLPLALLEAMSFGVIPVSTPAGGVVNVISDGKTGFLADGFDASSLTSAISRALLYKINAAEVISEYEKNFSMKTCAEHYSNLFLCA